MIIKIIMTQKSNNSNTSNNNNNKVLVIIIHIFYVNDVVAKTSGLNLGKKLRNLLSNHEALN